MVGGESAWPRCRHRIEAASFKRSVADHHHSHCHARLIPFSRFTRTRIAGRPARSTGRLAGWGVGALARAGIGTWAKFAASGIGQRVIGSAIGRGLGAGIRTSINLGNMNLGGGVPRIVDIARVAHKFVWKTTAA